MTARWCAVRCACRVRVPSPRWAKGAVSTLPPSPARARSSRPAHPPPPAALRVPLRPSRRPPQRASCVPPVPYANAAGRARAPAPFGGARLARIGASAASAGLPAARPHRRRVSAARTASAVRSLHRRSDEVDGALLRPFPEPLAQPRRPSSFPPRRARRNPAARAPFARQRLARPAARGGQTSRSRARVEAAGPRGVGTPRAPRAQPGALHPTPTHPTPHTTTTRARARASATRIRPGEPRGPPRIPIRWLQ